MKIGEILQQKAYPGRGIVMGKSQCGKKAIIAYFIMGRSDNSRNRTFIENGEDIRTEAFDEELVTDPSLIIYNPVKVVKNKTIVTNGNQTDLIDYYMRKKRLTFNQALRLISFEPDAPYYTPRISAIMNTDNCAYILSIVKTANGNTDSCQRFVYSYNNPLAGEGHFIHTYDEIDKNQEENILPSFRGEPLAFEFSEYDSDVDYFTNVIWRSLNADNKISLFVRFIDLETGKYQSRIVNKNGGASYVKYN